MLTSAVNTSLRFYSGFVLFFFHLSPHKVDVGTKERHSFATAADFQREFLGESAGTTLGMIPVFKKCFHSVFFSNMLVLQSQRLKFTLLLGFALEDCATALEETEQDHIRETSVFLGIIYLWWQRFQNCFRLLEQTRIPTYTTVVIVQRIFTNSHRYLLFLQLQPAASHSIFGQLAVIYKAKK